MILIATCRYIHRRNWLNRIGNLFAGTIVLAQFMAYSQSAALVAFTVDRYRTRNNSLSPSRQRQTSKDRSSSYSISAGYMVDLGLSGSSLAHSLVNHNESDMDLSWDKLCSMKNVYTDNLSLMSDQELVLRIHRGEQELFAELINRYKKKVGSLIYGLIQNPDDVDDIAQEVFIAVYQHLNRFEQRSTLNTWIYRITVNKCHDWYRKNKNRTFAPWHEEAAALADPSQIPDDESMMIRQLVNGLEEKYRLVIVLYYFHGLKCNEIGNVLGVPGKTVETRLFRARNILARNLERSVKSDG